MFSSEEILHHFGGGEACVKKRSHMLPVHNEQSVECASMAFFLLPPQSSVKKPFLWFYNNNKKKAPNVYSGFFLMCKLEMWISSSGLNRTTRILLLVFMQLDCRSVVAGEYLRRWRVIDSWTSLAKLNISVDAHSFFFLQRCKSIFLYDQSPASAVMQRSCYLLPFAHHLST